MLVFTPQIKQKKGVSKKRTITPFPSPPAGQYFQGIFTGISVEVYDPAHIREIYENGCFGKGSESRSVPRLLTYQNSHTSTEQSNESLTLGLEEACFLAYYLEVLVIQDMQSQPVTWQALIQTATELNPLFVEYLAAYLYLKSKCWVVKSGIKFGGNFLIYKDGPRFHHACFVVFICTSGKSNLYSTKDLKGLQRIAETSDKDVLLLEVNKPMDFNLNKLADIEVLSISETIVRRFNCTAFVQQSQNSTK